MATAQPHKPQHPHPGVPEEPEPGLPPVDPDQGPAPDLIPEDPERERIIGPATGWSPPAWRAERQHQAATCR